MSDENRNPDDVRRDIEHTRDELADTAAALAQKADVKARAKERVDEVKADVRDKAETVKDKVTPSSNGASAQGETGGFGASAQQAAGTAREQVRENPVPAAAIAAALLGFALGYLVAQR